MKKYRKIPHIVEAVQVFEDTDHHVIHHHESFERQWAVMTPEGWMNADYGDYLVKGIEGEYYPVKRSIFEKSYEEAEYEVKQ